MSEYYWKKKFVGVLSWDINIKLSLTEGRVGGELIQSLRNQFFSYRQFQRLVMSIRHDPHLEFSF